MEGQTTGLNVETAENAEVGTSGTGDGFTDLFLQAFTGQTDGTGDAPATGGDGNEPNGDGNGETTDVPATDAEPVDAEETNPTASDATESVPSPRILRYRDNHEEQEFNVSDATDEELIRMRQEANQFRRMKAAQAEYTDAEKFRASVQEKMKPFIEDYGIDGAKSLAVSGAIADGLKPYPISVSEDGAVSLTKNYLAIPDIESAETTPADAARTEPPKPTLDAELKKIRAAFPSLTEIPPEATEIAKGGVPLFEAVMLTQFRNIQARAAAAEKENKILRQNAEAARKAPVRGVSGGSPQTRNAADNDPFLREFLKP